MIDILNDHENSSKRTIWLDFGSICILVLLVLTNDTENIELNVTKRSKHKNAKNVFVMNALWLVFVIVVCKLEITIVMFFLHNLHATYHYLSDLPYHHRHILT